MIDPETDFPPQGLFYQWGVRMRLSRSGETFTGQCIRDDRYIDEARPGWVFFADRRGVVYSTRDVLHQPIEWLKRPSNPRSDGDQDDGD